MQSDIINELYKKYYHSALLYTLSLCKDRAAAEDIVSEAFCKALMTADDHVESFKAWLLAVCRNLWFNHSRKAKRHTKLSDDVADERESLVDTLIANESYRALYKAISLLPVIQREIITLFYFESMRVDDIATLTGKTPTNVKVLLYRAREALKKILEA